MRSPVAAVQKETGTFVVFCDDGSVWSLYHATAGQYEWAEFAKPLPGSAAAEEAALPPPFPEG